MRDSAFFSPSLDPVLQRGKGHEYPVVTPQVPTRGPIGQAVFHHDAHGDVNDAAGVCAFGRWQVLNTGDAFRGIGSILAGSEHDRLLLTNKVGTPIYAEKHCPIQTQPGSDTTVFKTRGLSCFPRK